MADVRAPLRADGEPPAAARSATGGAQRRPARPRRPVHGVLLIDKPVGWTSQDLLSKVKGLMRAEKAGHTGTLDPLASGLLPLCLGAATKFAQVSLDADKAYRATLHLGQTRRGGDREGEVLQERPLHVDRAALEAVLQRFSGPIRQVPPMHSALKHQGKALYEYARAGVEIERAPREVILHRLELIHWEAECLVIDLSCSKGTYVRALAEDIGEALGCGAHLAALRRTASGPLRIGQALTLEALQALDEAQRDALLLPPDALLQAWPALQLPAEEAGRFLSGLRRRVSAPDMPNVRVYGPEPRAFLGSAHVLAGELIADRLLSPPEVQALLAAPHPAAQPA
ncbi:MAG: tRNA pseudouridine(55) synthase TruB [Rubrivivax sp.]|nr:tRNA pseudouridine(55) synthase TruB [Rubrivivax sp.]